MCKPLLSALLWCAVLLPGISGALDTSATPHKSKPSSFAPRHSGKHVYGAPIQHPILHKRHKASHKASRSAAAASGQRTDSAVH